MSYNALSKYEKGEMLPSSKVLIALKHALHMNPDFFFRSFEVQLSSIHFRKRKSKLSIKEEHRILAESKDFFERYLEIEEILEIRKPFINPLDQHLIKTDDDAEQAANDLRKMWHLGSAPLANIQEMLEEQNLKICELETSESFDGFCANADHSKVLVIGKWLNKNLPRKRSTEVHELGHAILKVPNNITEKQEERLIKRFAGAFLAPACILKQRFGEKRQKISIQELVDIKLLYGISIESLIIRLGQLGIISETSVKQFWPLSRKLGWHINGEPGDKEYQQKGEEISRRFLSLIYRALEENIITISKASALSGLSVNILRKDPCLLKK